MLHRLSRLTPSVQCLRRATEPWICSHDRVCCASGLVHAKRRVKRHSHSQPGLTIQETRQKGGQPFRFCACTCFVFHPLVQCSRLPPVYAASTHLPPVASSKLRVVVNVSPPFPQKPRSFAPRIAWQSGSHAASP
jgi:hypothetical protein